MSLGESNPRDHVRKSDGECTYDTSVSGIRSDIRTEVATSSDSSELEVIAKAWPDLPDAIKRGIVEMIRVVNE